MDAEEIKEIHKNPLRSAKLAGLKYVNDNIPGITRKKSGKSFNFFDKDGKKITDEDELKRIRGLVLPPAWKNVWISPHKNGHLQATGIDARGRKQYKYHKDWVELRNLNKFDRMLLFGEHLPAIRKKVKEDLELSGMPKGKVLALVVTLLDKTFLRIGNEEYEKANETYGLTTLKNRHVKINKDEVRFKFRAKSGKESVLDLQDKLLAKLIKKCKDIPGFYLFEYFDETGAARDINSNDVNEYLKEITGEDFTAKDFRTWGGTVNALIALKGCLECETEKDIKNAVTTCYKTVAEQLKNTVAVCKKYYIHPKIIEHYSGRTLDKFLNGSSVHLRSSPNGLSKDEKLVLNILQDAA